jgi:hypothetical protein
LTSRAACVTIALRYVVCCSHIVALRDQRIYHVPATFTTTAVGCLQIAEKIEIANSA